MSEKSPEPVTFEVGVDTYTLRLDFASICRVEERFDLNFPEFMARLGTGSPRFGYVLALFHALLGRAHPDITEDRAAQLIEGVGLERAVELIGEAVETSPVFKGFAGLKSKRKKAA